MSTSSTDLKKLKNEALTENDSGAIIDIINIELKQQVTDPSLVISAILSLRKKIVHFIIGCQYWVVFRKGGYVEGFGASKKVLDVERRYSYHDGLLLFVIYRLNM